MIHDFIHSFYFVILVVVYSIYGYAFLMDYYVRCKIADCEPFNGSSFKLIYTSLFCGVLTTIILIVAGIEMIRDFLREKL